METRTQDMDLQILKKLYFSNCEDAAFYKNSSTFIRRIFFKRFFQRLRNQKQSFKKTLKVLILEKIQEPSEIIDYRIKKNNKSSSCFHYFNYPRNKNRVIKECHRKELKALAAYQMAINKLKDKKLKAALEEHLQEIKLVVREMNVMGVIRFFV
ncbi:hypothetical protein SAMN05444483_101660 [Salegentibacter echinorum]|uniref:Uncharacterized protein n=1 Tax=Salegentibacter echinorum TaxID=1073325 RepID=A0A1M5CT91_SALEC|nr:hypothetical protein [Salegentibacter echinorum]SHF57978.1 hypothetical protein SAMN05444483_101660 [Salegentibacter echinorum]